MTSYSYNRGSRRDEQSINMPRKPAVAASVSVSPDQVEASPSPGDPSDWEVVAYDGLASKNRAREASLTAVCLVCGGKAAAHQHYGAVCCYSCRAFFRRGITRSYACVRGDMSCQVNSITRTNCKRCRFERCLAVGMRPELVDASLRRKQEEKRRSELVEIQQEMGIQTMESENQAVTGMIQLGQGGVLRDRAHHGPHHQRLVQQALQGLQQPVPKHLLDNTDDYEPVQTVKKEAGGSKKVLLELRHHSGGSPPSKSRPSPIIKSESIVTVSSQPDADPSGRQQTYYIFHPMTQTFEPITIAEGLDSSVVQEIVVGQDNIVRIGSNDDIETVEAYEEVQDETILGDIPSPPNGVVELEARKPVISPVIKEGRKRLQHSEASGSNLKIMRVESSSSKSQKSSVIRKLTNELIEETVVSESSDNFIYQDDPRNNDIQQGVSENLDSQDQEVSDDEECQREAGERKNVNIEDLVDVCFEEELSQTTILEEDEIVNEVVKVIRKGKRSLVTDDLVSPLPLKKRLQCKNVDLEECFVPLVEYFSHKILEFEFTTEERTKLELIKSQFQPSTRKDRDGNGLKCVSTTSKFKDFIFALLPVSGSLHEGLSNRDCFKEALKLLATDFNLKAMFVILRKEQSEGKLPASLRNNCLLLYRYLTSVCPVSEASSLTHAVQGIINQCSSQKN